MTERTTQETTGRRNNNMESIPHRSLDHFHLFYDSSPFGYQSLNADGHIEYVNQAWLEMLGYTRKEVVGRWFGEFITSSTRPEFPGRFADFKQAGQVKAVQWDMIHKNGRVITVEFDGRAVYDAQGNFNRCHCIARDITEQSRAIRALEVSEQMYHTLIDGLPDIVMRFDRDGRHLFASENVSSVTGIPATGYIGKTHRELGFPQDKCQVWEETIRTVFDTGQAHESEYTCENQNGATVFNWRLLPERDTDGHIVSVLSVSRDVTAHRQAQEALRESEKRYRLLFDQMLSGMALHEVVTDESGAPVDYRFLSVNAAFDDLTGLKAEDVLGRTIREVLPETEPLWIERFGQVALTGEPIQFVEHLGPLGRYFQVRAYCPKPRQFVAVFNDVTELRSAIDELRASQEKLATIFDSAPAMMLVLDRRHRVRHANRAFEAFSNSSASSIEGRSLCGIIGCTGALDNPCARAVGPKCDACRLGRAIEDTLSTGTSHHNVEYCGRIEREDGFGEVVLLGATATVQSGDEPNLLLCLQDVTEQRAATDRAKQREAELAHVSRLTTLGEMASGLAHELNQPLSAILNYGAACSKLASASFPDLKRIRTNLSRIVVQADRATQIMSRIRAFAQRRPPRLGPVDLAQATARVIELLSWDIRQKGVDIRLELHDTLAPVPADAVQIDQVLINLVRNAIEAMQDVPRARRQLTIRTGVGTTGAAEVEISDTGVGLPEKNADRVFEAFFSTKPDGLGIGLSISRTIVEMHNGTLNVCRNSGPGCTFKMVLPTEPQAESQTP